MVKNNYWGLVLKQNFVGFCQTLLENFGYVTAIEFALI